MSPKTFTAGNRRPTFFARTFRELKVTFVRAVTVEQQRVLVQEGKWQCVDCQHMECEVLTDFGRTAEDSSGHTDTKPTDTTHSSHTTANQK